MYCNIWVSSNKTHDLRILFEITYAAYWAKRPCAHDQCDSYVRINVEIISIFVA
jgi:hypothetical protein